MSRKLSFLIITLIVSVIFLPVNSQVIKQRKGKDKIIRGGPDINLILKLDKSKYQVKQPIELITYLENLSLNKPIYIGKELGGFFTILPNHYLELEIKDAKGKDIDLMKSAAAGVSKNEPISEIISKDYFLLDPGSIYGLKRLFMLHLKPGTYKFRVTYNELEARKWRKDELSKVPYPVLITSIRSNIVIIKIVK